MLNFTLCGHLKLQQMQKPTCWKGFVAHWMFSWSEDYNGNAACSKVTRVRGSTLNCHSKRVFLSLCRPVFYYSPDMTEVDYTRPLITFPKLLEWPVTLPHSNELSPLLDSMGYCAVVWLQLLVILEKCWLGGSKFAFDNWHLLLQTDKGLNSLSLGKGDVCEKTWAKLLSVTERWANLFPWHRVKPWVAV